MPRPAPPGAEQQRLREITEQVVLAEEMGFEHVWFVEHHFLTEWAHSSAPEVMLAVLSQHTTKMRLGFGVVLLPVHHPLHVAAKTATLDIMSDGRVDVGVGRAGNPYQLEPFGVKLEDTRCIWAGLPTLRMVWTESSGGGGFWSSHRRETWNTSWIWGALLRTAVLPLPMDSPLSLALRPASPARSMWLTCRAWS